MAERVAVVNGCWSDEKYPWARSSIEGRASAIVLKQGRVDRIYFPTGNQFSQEVLP